MDYEDGSISGASRISLCILLILVIVYALQAFSPLRLNGDAVVLLSMANSAAQGHGFLDDGEKTAFPPGYPSLVIALQWLGCAHSWGIIGLNIILLIAGLAGVYRLILRSFFKDKVVALNLCSLFLLSFAVVKHATLPLTEAPFFCSSMWCLTLMDDSRLSKRRRLIVVLASAWLLAFASIAFRRIGVALIPALIFIMVFRPGSIAIWKRLDVRSKAVAVLICIALAVATVWIVIATSALFDFKAFIHHTNLSSLPFQIFSFRITELGQLFANVPASKIPAPFHSLLPWFGLLLLLLTLSGLLSRRRGNFGSTEVFMVCYMGILFAWPAGSDPRFWLPVVPLLIAYSALAVKEGVRMRLTKAVVACYCIGFFILGVVALGFSTRITFAGSRFPDEYGGAGLRSTYCAALESCPQGFDSTMVDPKVLRLLREYN